MKLITHNQNTRSHPEEEFRDPAGTRYRTIHRRHPNIQQDEVGRRLCHSLHRLQCGVSNSHDLEALLPLWFQLSQFQLFSIPPSSDRPLIADHRPLTPLDFRTAQATAKENGRQRTTGKGPAAPGPIDASGAAAGARWAEPEGADDKFPQKLLAMAPERCILPASDR